jgi:uncharacterized membrane protein YbhN (UPF0104 family)
MLEVRQPSGLPPPGSARTTAPRWRVRAAGALSIFILVAAALTLHRDATFWDWHRLASGLRNEPLSWVAAAAAFTLASFVALGAYDILGCALVIPGRIRHSTALLAGVAGNAISNTLGFHAVIGTAVRLRIYGRAGVPMGDAMRVTSVSWLGIGLGYVALIALAGLAGQRFGGIGAVPSLSTAVALTVGLALFVFWLSDDGRTLRLGPARLELPPTRTAMALVALGVIENGAAIAALYVLLPAASAPPFLPFALSYLSAVALGVASQVPGGLGVFEAALMTIWAARIGPGLPVALVAYRLIYNLLPCALSVLSLAAWEVAGAGKASV